MCNTARLVLNASWDDDRLPEDRTMAETLDTVAAKLDLLSAAVDKRFEQVDKRFAQVESEFDALRELIKTEGETTRRHFDVVAERMKDERNLALDKSMETGRQLLVLTASNAADHVTFERRLDDHEQRLQRMEQK